MKQEIVTYLSTIKEDIHKLSTFLFQNPEPSFSEYKACNYIVNLLKEHNFKVTENFLDMPTAFYAEFGSGHPKICYLCEYDAAPQGGHISGHNLISSMSIAAALSLSKVVGKTKGSIIVIGCPGEYVGGAKVTMAKQDVFKDIDAGLMAHPDVVTATSGTSMAVLPLKIKYKAPEESHQKKVGMYSALDACLFTFNSLTLLMQRFEHCCSIDRVVLEGGSVPHLLPNEAEARFYIRAPKMKKAEDIESKIKELVKTTNIIMNVSSETSLYELPYEELIPSTALSRIFSHNLKESGMINIEDVKNSNYGLSLGNVSRCIPCIQPYICVVEDSSIKYSTPEFAVATTSHYAQDKVLMAAQALAFTGLDLIQKEELLNEIKLEHNENCTK